MTLTHALVATDFSPGATEALNRAAMIARLGNVAQLTVIHVLQHGLLDALRELIGRSEDQQIRRIAEERLRTQVDELRDAAGVEVTPRLLDGDARPLIVEETRLIGAALVIVGAHGADDLRRALLGSTSEWVASASPAPTLIVKRPAKKRYRRVLLPVDLRTPPDQAFDLARTLAPGAELILMHAFEVPFEGQLRYAGVEESEVEYYRSKAHDEAMRSLRALRDRLASPDEICEMTAMRGMAHRAILEAEKSFKPDLLVLPRHAAGRIEQWLIGSVARRVVEQCRSDIAVLPP